MPSFPILIVDPDGFLLTCTKGPVEPDLGMEQVVRRSTEPRRPMRPDWKAERRPVESTHAVTA